MAGKLQKKANDRFYFVLDEIGRSDNDSEDGSEDKTSSSGKKVMDKSSPLVSTESDDLSHLIVKDVVGNVDGSCDDNLEVNMDICKNTSDCDEIDDALKETMPFLKISFRNENIAQQYKNQLTRSILNILPHIIVKPSEQNNSLEIEFWEKEKNVDSERVVTENLLSFGINTVPDKYTHYGIAPKYGVACDKIMMENNISGEDDKKTKTGFCFNCEGNHNLRDCPLPKNFQVINKNRLIFQNNKSQVKMPSRYHLDETQKFSHLKPGCVSSKLRNALKLKKDEVPCFIYRMRQLGYPPGWLEEARISHSGVTLYDTKGERVLEEDEEEGEIVPDGAKDKYDINKIIDFPGFNVPLPDDMKDESTKYKCPSISEAQSKVEMVKELAPNAVQAYKKQDLSLPSEQADDQDDVRSPTLEEMEERKQQLLLQLNEDGSSSPSSSNSIKLSREPSSSSPLTITTSSSLLNAINTPSPPNMKRGRAVCSIEFGTPILKSVSPFAKLPSAEKFSVNVCDVINFENLPDSTGKYETMTHLISKIRKVVGKKSSE